MSPEELKLRHEKIQTIYQRCSTNNQSRRRRQKELLSSEINFLSAKELAELRTKLKNQQ